MTMMQIAEAHGLPAAVTEAVEKVEKARQKARLVAVGRGWSFQAAEPPVLNPDALEVRARRRWAAWRSGRASLTIVAVRSAETACGR